MHIPPHSEFLEWKGRRAWVRVPAPAETRQFGEVMHVFLVSPSPHDCQLAIQLDTGAVHKVRVSDKGKLWDLAG